MLSAIIKLSTVKVQSVKFQSLCFKNLFVQSWLKRINDKCAAKEI